MEVVYLKSNRRRPVRFTPDPEPDRQARLPVWWCEKCGMDVYEIEVFGAGRLCDVCLRERRMINENRKSERNQQPVSDLYPRAGSGAM